MIHLRLPRPALAWSSIRHVARRSASAPVLALTDSAQPLTIANRHDAEGASVQRRLDQRSSGRSELVRGESAGRELTGRMRKGRPADRRGAYAVEFAVSATVLLISIFASIELARYMFVRQVIDQVAYEACRTGVVAGATAAGVRDRAIQLLGAQGITAASVTVSPSTFTATTTEVAVEITCNYAHNTWVPPMFLPGTAIKTRTVLDHENQAYLVPEAAAAAAENIANAEPLDV